MLSILIPVYNIDCTKLVLGIHSQCRKLNIPFEILVYDDNSRPKMKMKNFPLSQLFGVSYVELKENKGRAKIRNLLGKYSNYDNLLFIDADSRLPNKSYIKNYLPYIGKYKVLYGGRTYTKRKPSSVPKIFHWTYGIKREALNAKKRNKHPHLNFMSNNFIIQRNVFEGIGFDEKHEGYGYEDTLFALELKQKGVNIFHLDNPLLHSGIEKVDIYLEKTKNALDNLITLYNNGKNLNTRLLRFYHFTEKYAISSFLFSFADKRIDQFESNFKSANPSMRKFDLWKFHYFYKKMKDL